MTAIEIVDYIKSIDRIGCDPFEFIDESIILDNYTEFELVELTWETDVVDWLHVEQYDPSPINRIKRKTKTLSERLYYTHHVYNDALKYPPVIGHDGYILDGSHRLRNIMHNKLTFSAWIPVST